MPESRRESKIVICPYCGDTQSAADRCRLCGGMFEPLSRQATHNAMGPWFVHDRDRPHQPGCSYETLAKMIERGQVTKYTIIRGPTSKQFWTIAKHVPGVAHLLGYCHDCDAPVESTAHGCPRCGVPFGAYLDRNYLGLPEIRPLPGETPDLAEVHDHADTMHAVVPTPPGLSSFAADEELLGGPPVSNGDRGAESTATMTARPVEVAGRPFVPDGRSPHGADAAPTGAAPRGAVAAGAASAADLLSSPAVRSMQRRIARQDRTIRLLAGLVFIIALVGAVALIAISRARAAPSPAGETESIPAMSGDATSIETADPEKPGDTLEQPAPPPSDEELDAWPDGALDATPDSTGDEPAIERLDDANDTTADRAGREPAPANAIERARTLTAAAADAERPIAERLRDAEAALAILEGLLGTTTDEIARAALTEEVQGLEAILERLRAEEFFPRSP